MTVQADFAATLVDEWARCGVDRAVVCPGSRSTPLAVALARDPRIDVIVRLDERSAAFLAVGVGLASGRPCLLVTTSGTAAAEVHAAVVEAHQAFVPLIVCTADRPPELRDVGAPQTIDQRTLFGTALRWSVDPGVPATEARHTWRALAARVVAAAQDHPLGAGPVHLNLPLREPLLGDAGEMPEGRPDGRPWQQIGPLSPTPEPGDLARIAAQLAARRRGVIVAGEGCAPLEHVYALGELLGWPVLADPRAGGREPSPMLVAAADQLLLAPALAEAWRPDAVLRLGAPAASKVVAEWLAASGADPFVVVERTWPWRDPEGSATEVLFADGALAAHGLLDLLAGGTCATESGWSDRWYRGEAAAQSAIDAVLSGCVELTEPAVARTLYAAVPAGSAVLASSSMPVRDLEWFAAPRRRPPVVLANRGANGIDGVTSTALGVAASGALGPVTALLGDLAFLHDLSALVWGTGAGAGPGGPPPARIVVVDNGGGGIFSFLPQAGALPPPIFEQLFATPQRTDIAGVARAAGCEVHEIDSVGEFGRRLEVPATDLEVVVVHTDRSHNTAAHRDLALAVEAAAGSTEG